MRLKNTLDCDVLVVGAGLAGITAALSAAESGAKTCIMSCAQIGSGSSFYPGTWGLGLIGPEGPEDEADLEQTILSVGEGMADPQLVHTFVTQIHESILYLEQLGVELKEAQQKGEKEFIPCFDHKGRDWHGLLKESARGVFLKQLEERSLLMLDHMFTAALVKQKAVFRESGSAPMGEDGERICGAIAVGRDGALRLISCKSLVLASGGLGGLFQHRLNTDDATAMGQYLALKAGAALVNLEFMQMMPGFLQPAPKTIYNEKVFHYTDFTDPDTGADLFSGWGEKELADRMAVRSTHGPFTTRLTSGPVDEKLFEAFLRCPDGIRMTYKKELRGRQPEFIRTYFEWLWEEKHLTVDDPVQLGIFAHASNGGILIDGSGFTGVPGLYACGEVTGGMHGADRLGGLSTANALVFGRLSGRAAAAAASGPELAASMSKLAGSAPKRAVPASTTDVSGFRGFSVEYCPDIYPQSGALLKELRAINFQSAMIFRDEGRCRAAQERFGELEEQMQSEAGPPESSDSGALKDSLTFEAALCLSRCLSGAIRMRAESRGPHKRLDAPQKEERYGSRILTSWDGGIVQRWERDQDP